MLSLTLTLEDGHTFFLQVSPDSDLVSLKGFIEAETGIPASRQILVVDGKVLDTQQNATLAALRFPQDPLIMVVPRPEAQQSSPAQRPLTSSAPSSAPSSVAGSVAGSAAEVPPVDPRLLRAYQERLLLAEHMAKLEQDPMNEESQRFIEEAIRQQNINDNMEIAMEHHPEAFAQVVMLFIDVRINNVPVKAFVDSGAQVTIMSDACARRCNLWHLLDKRFGGNQLKGVGSARSAGRIHNAPLHIGANVFHCSFTVLESTDIELLLGLDFLRRHQCVLDLSHANNHLRIGDEIAPFLPEKDIPKSFLQAHAPPGQTPNSAGSSSSSSSSSSLASSSSSASASSASSSSSASSFSSPSPFISSTTTTTTAPSTLTPTQDHAASRVAAGAPTATHRPLQPSSGSPAPGLRIDPQAVQQIMDCTGVSREDAERALVAAHGNADLAASYLMFG